MAVAWSAWRAGRAGPAGLATRQRQRFQHVVAFARERSPFYRRLYQRVAPGVVEPAQLPPVTKRDLMASFDSWATDPSVTLADVEVFAADPERVGELFQGRYAVWRTSGMTGEPGLVVHDRAALETYRGLQLARGWLPWLSWGRIRDIVCRGERLAAVTATGGHYAHFSLMELARRHDPQSLRQARTFSVFSPLPRLVEALNHYQPTELVSYPSTLALLAAEKTAGRLAIAPAFVGSGGEWLTPLARRIISTAFNCPLRENYGASEFPSVATECRNGRLHVNADWILLEPVDEQYQPVPAGEASHTTLVTNLVNRVQPIIRYDLGDSLTVMAQACACGRGLPAIQLEGRRDETLILAATDGKRIRLRARPVAAVLERTAGLASYQVVQTGQATLQLRLSAQQGADSSLVRTEASGLLRSWLDGLDLGSVSVELVSEVPPRSSTTDKYRVLWSAWTDGSPDREAQPRGLVW